MVRFLFRICGPLFVVLPNIYYLTEIENIWCADRRCRGKIFQKCNFLAIFDKIYQFSLSGESSTKGSFLLQRFVTLNRWQLNQHKVLIDTTKVLPTSLKNMILKSLLEVKF